MALGKQGIWLLIFTDGKTQGIWTRQAILLIFRLSCDLMSGGGYF